MPVSVTKVGQNNKFIGDDIMENDIVDFMKRLWESRLTTSLGGNISCRLDDDKIIITPSSIDKAKLTCDDLVTIDKDGNVISGKYKPSMEYMMHVAVYNERNDVNAIIHAHPQYSTIFSTSETAINLNYTSEACKNIKQIGIAEYKMMGTVELANEVANKSKKNNVVLMKNHGVLTVGKDLLQAFYRMEVLEQAAKMTYHSLSLKMNELSTKEVSFLKSL